VALWLYAGQSERLTASAQGLIEEGNLRVSPMTALELGYLHEVRRARDPVAQMLSALRRDIGLEVADAELMEVVQAAIDLTWTRNPFDRMISAHAIVAGAPLVTADRTIRDNLSLAVWD
jgi:PIN domain nuclease of toxin-antitoxin system